MPWVLRYVWALPNTLLGLMLGALSFQRPRLHRGALLFDRGPRGWVWMFDKLTPFRAITFGHVVLSTGPLGGRLLAHELAHVRQYELLGPAYLLVYGALFAVRGYRRHPLEVAARVAASEAATRAGPPAGPA